MFLKRFALVVSLVLVNSIVVCAQEPTPTGQPDSVVADPALVEPLAVELLDEAPVGRANSNRAARQEIRSMDILERPQRTGHFYGNTVRRRFHRGAYPLRSLWQ